MKTILKNGKIYMEKGVFCEALFIDDGVIRAAGTNDEVLAAAGLTIGGASGEGDVAGDAASGAAGDTAGAGGQGDSSEDIQVIDCKGRTVVPGFNDTHMHLMKFSESLASVKITGADSVDVLVDRCRAYMEEHPDRVRHGLVGTGWNQDLFKGERRMPDRHDLDRISTDVPVVLERVCAHCQAANTKAIEMMLEKAGGKVPAVEGGEIVLDENGYPTGIFNDNAMMLVTDLIPPLEDDERLELLKEGMQYAVSRGYTSLQSSDYGCFGLDGPTARRLIEAIRERGDLPLRYRYQCVFDAVEEFEESLHKGIYTNVTIGTAGDARSAAWMTDAPSAGSLGDAAPATTVGPLKLFADGSLGARTALLGSDYADDPGNRGIGTLSDDELRTFVKTANAHGIQVITHAIGDQGVRNVLDAYEAADPTGTNPCRNTINHCQITDRECLDRIRDGNILVAVQPIFLEYDIHMAEDRVGPEMIRTSYAFNTMYKEGVHQSFGTDSPVEDLNPFANMYTAVTRKDLECEPAGGWYPDECMDIYDAVDCATYEGAYMEFAEDVKGRLKPGYLADLVILDKDIFTCPQDEIKDILPVMTMVGGKVVFEEESL